MSREAKSLLTPKQIEEASRLANDGWSFPRIAERLGCHPETVRRAIDAEFAAKRVIQVREARQRRYKPAKRETKTARESATAVSVKEDAAARLAEVPRDDRSLTGILMGDPLGPRSALAKRI